jgi:hypothetical protein
MPNGPGFPPGRRFPLALAEVDSALIFRYADHDEVFTAGDAYYGAPGHLPLLFAGTELVEFSPTSPLNEMMGVIGKNLEAARAAGSP